MCVFVLAVLPGQRMNIEPMAIANHTHLRCHPQARVGESELGHSARQAAGPPQSFCPDLWSESEKPLRGWYLVPGWNQSHRHHKL